jgi:hypothetical protein
MTINLDVILKIALLVLVVLGIIWLAVTIW